MKWDDQVNDQRMLEVVGERLAAHRLAQNLTQAELAEEAGLGLRTVQRIETGETAANLAGFLRILRVLGLLGRFDALLPEPGPSPMEQLRLQGRRRQRATGKRGKGADRVEEERPEWTWGE